MLLRLSKILVTAASALFLFFVVFNNTTDYWSNYNFVDHVLSMDTTFKGNAGMWRAMPSPLIHHLFYAGIILWEFVSFLLIALGTFKLWQARAGSTIAWQKAKGLAALGLTLSLFQWYFAFITIGGEWFLMWQSRIWNGQDAAFRMFTMMGIGLIHLTMRNDDLETA